MECCHVIYDSMTTYSEIIWVTAETGAAHGMQTYLAFLLLSCSVRFIVHLHTWCELFVSCSISRHKAAEVIIGIDVCVSVVWLGLVTVRSVLHRHAWPHRTWHPPQSSFTSLGKTEQQTPLNITSLGRLSFVRVQVLLCAVLIPSAVPHVRRCMHSLVTTCTR